jgi:hypothetical protein
LIALRLVHVLGFFFSVEMKNLAGEMFKVAIEIEA